MNIKYYLYYQVDTFVKIQTQFESWQSWSPCSGSCGETGTRFRTRGCHHVVVGFLKFSHECPIEGEEKQTCVGDCSTLSTVIKQHCLKVIFLNSKHDMSLINITVFCVSYNAFIEESGSGVLF